MLLIQAITPPVNDKHSFNKGLVITPKIWKFFINIILNLAQSCFSLFCVKWTQNNKKMILLGSVIPSKGIGIIIVRNIRAVPNRMITLWVQINCCDVTVHNEITPLLYLIVIISLCFCQFLSYNVFRINIITCHFFIRVTMIIKLVLLTRLRILSKVYISTLLLQGSLNRPKCVNYLLAVGWR